MSFPGGEVGSGQHLYRSLKNMECSAQGMLFDIPDEGSDAFNAMDITRSEAWKMGALISALSWFRDKASQAANRVYIEGRPDLQDPHAEEVEGV